MMMMMMMMMMMVMNDGDFCTDHSYRRAYCWCDLMMMMMMMMMMMVMNDDVIPHLLSVDG